METNGIEIELIEQHAGGGVISENMELELSKTFIPSHEIATVGFEVDEILESPIQLREIVNHRTRSRGVNAISEVNSIQGVRTCETITDLLATPSDYRVQGGIYVVRRYDISDYDATFNNPVILLYNGENVDDLNWQNLSNFTGIPYLTSVSTKTTTLHFSQTGDDRTADGTESKPFRNILAALRYIRSSEFIPHLIMKFGAGEWVVDSSILEVANSLRIGQTTYIGSAETVVTDQLFTNTGVNAYSNGSVMISSIYKGYFVSKTSAGVRELGGIPIMDNSTTELFIPSMSDTEVVTLNTNTIHRLQTKITVTQDLGTKTTFYDCGLVLSNLTTLADKTLIGCNIEVVGTLNVATNNTTKGCIVDTSQGQINILSGVNVLVMTNTYAKGSSSSDFLVLPKEQRQRMIQCRVKDLVLEDYSHAFRVERSRRFVLFSNAGLLLNNCTGVVDNQSGSVLDLNLRMYGEGFTYVMKYGNGQIKCDVNDSEKYTHEHIFETMSGVNFISKEKNIYVRGENLQTEIGSVVTQTLPSDGYLSQDIGYRDILKTATVVIESLRIGDYYGFGESKVIVKPDQSIDHFTSMVVYDSTGNEVTDYPFGLSVAIESDNIRVLITTTETLTIKYRINHVLK